ncbi:hypothetical protein BY996DRAFT_6413585 [Phakopsora pachyrhizi]|nr:hypothetical protein BY996DRAFT_6413585 [Phakopsora pachyrhizi]
MLYVLGSSVVYRFYNPDARCSGSQANSLAGHFGDLFLGVILRTSALKSSNLRDSSLRRSLTICDRLASGTFLRLLGAYTCTGWASGTSKSSSGSAGVPTYKEQSSICCAASNTPVATVQQQLLHTHLCVTGLPVTWNYGFYTSYKKSVSCNP